MQPNFSFRLIIVNFISCVSLLISGAAIAQVSNGTARLPRIGDPIQLMPAPNAEWRIRNEPNQGHYASLYMLRPEGNPVEVTLSCVGHRGSITLSEPWREQDVLYVHMHARTIADSRGASRTLMREEAIRDIAGYSTRWVEKRQFIAAMKAMSGLSSFIIDIEGKTNRFEFRLNALNSEIFDRMAQWCARDMKDPSEK
jgi:hypothetical protein